MAYGIIRTKRKRTYSVLCVCAENLAGFVAGDVCHFTAKIANFIECYDASSTKVIGFKGVCGIVSVIVNNVRCFISLSFLLVIIV